LTRPWQGSVSRRSAAERQNGHPMLGTYVRCKDTEGNIFTMLQAVPESMSGACQPSANGDVLHPQRQLIGPSHLL
jgi:hypothetical protein